jgi:hypothetical protein
MNVVGNYQITATSEMGQILYTLDGTDPRLIGGQINSSAKSISSGGTIDLSGTAIINSRIKIGLEWSALVTKKFLDLNEDYTKLKVTELHYHPADTIAGTDTVSGKSFEFIELKNIGDRPIKLEGLNFTSGIQYQFKAGEVLAPRQFYVVASKPKWFWERHWMVPSGNFEKNFSNTGEQVVISDPAGTPVIDFQYFVTNPWPVLPDGNGNSLSSALKIPSGNPNDFSYWKASSVYDGSPFADDPGIVDSIVDNTSSDNFVVIYPNPTKGLLFLKVEDQKSRAQVQIYSLSGSIIYNSLLVGNTVIDLGLLKIQAGIYLINTKCDQKNSVVKIVYQP